MTLRTDIFPPTVGILFGLLGMFTPSDVAAFWKPAETRFTANCHVQSIRLLPFVEVNTSQTDVMQSIDNQAFREKLTAYLATEWTQDVGDQDLEAVVTSVIADDCPRLEMCREMDIVILSVARLRIPERVASKDFWDAVIEQRPNPNQRAGAFLTEMIVGLDNVDTIAFYRRVNGWWQFGK